MPADGAGITTIDLFAYCVGARRFTHIIPEIGMRCRNFAMKPEKAAYTFRGWCILLVELSLDRA